MVFFLIVKNAVSLVQETKNITSSGRNLIINLVKCNNAIVGIFDNKFKKLELIEESFKKGNVLDVIAYEIIPVILIRFVNRTVIF